MQGEEQVEAAVKGKHVLESSYTYANLKVHLNVASSGWSDESEWKGLCVPEGSWGG